MKLSHNILYPAPNFSFSLVSLLWKKLNFLIECCSLFYLYKTSLLLTYFIMTPVRLTGTRNGSEIMHISDQQCQRHSLFRQKLLDSETVQYYRRPHVIHRRQHSFSNSWVRLPYWCWLVGHLDSGHVTAVPRCRALWRSPLEISQRVELFTCRLRCVSSQYCLSVLTYHVLTYSYNGQFNSSYKDPFCILKYFIWLIIHSK